MVTILGDQEDTTAGRRGGSGPGSNVDNNAGPPGTPDTHYGEDMDPTPDQNISPYMDPDAGLGLLNVVTSFIFPLVGRATFLACATGAATLAEGCYGTGVATYLLTKDHMPIVGPCTFYMPGDVAPVGPGSSGCMG